MEKQIKQTPMLVIGCSEAEYIFGFDEIICIEASSSQACIYAHAHSNHEPKVVVCKNLKEMEELLPANRFFRCHRTWIVNLKYTKAHIKAEHQLLLSNNMKVPVSRERIGFFKPALEVYYSTIHTV